MKWTKEDMEVIEDMLNTLKATKFLALNKEKGELLKTINNY